MAKGNPQTKRFRAVAVGRVQGVGFRYFAQREAVRLKLVGTVRNLANGNVEVVAQGPSDVLNEFLNKLREGPPLGWVEHVAIDWLPPEAALTTFSIKPTGW